MSRIHVGEDGTLVLALEQGESIRVRGGGHTLAVSLDAGGTLAAALRAGGELPGIEAVRTTAVSAAPAPENGAAPAPDPLGGLGVPELLSASDAIREIVNIFQQVNVKARAAKDHHGEDTPEHARAVDRLKDDAMHRVAEVCERYLQG